MSLRNYKKWLKSSEIEFKKYVSTKDEERLAQAGEKIWNAFNHLIQHIVRKRLKSFSSIRNASRDLEIQKNDSVFTETFDGAYDLHRFFYGNLVEDVSEFKNKYIQVRALMIEIERNYT